MAPSTIPAPTVSRNGKRRSIMASWPATSGQPNRHGSGFGNRRRHSQVQGVTWRAGGGIGATMIA